MTYHAALTRVNRLAVAKAGLVWQMACVEVHQ